MSKHIQSSICAAKNNWSEAARYHHPTTAATGMANKAVIKHLSDRKEKLCQTGDCFETGSLRGQHENCEWARE